MTRNRFPDRRPVVFRLEVEMQANRDHVVMVIPIDVRKLPPGTGTIGIRFNSPEEMLEVFNHFMIKAAEVWPDNEWMQEYLKD